MFRSFFLILFLVLTLPVIAAANYTVEIDKASCHNLWFDYLQSEDLEKRYKPLIGSCNEAFRSKLQQIIATNIDLGYRNARSIMFSSIDNRSGIVKSVYTGQFVETLGIPDASIMNCEHTWPQSRGAVGIAKSDLHHLFPVISRVNSRRSNHPFCNVVIIKTEEEGSFLGESLEGTRCFEPRSEHKGDVARSMAYFAIRYGKHIDSAQERYLRKWYRQDRVSLKEQNRNNAIEQVQMNRNPFVDHPEFLSFMADL